MASPSSWNVSRDGVRIVTYANASGVYNRSETVVSAFSDIGSRYSQNTPGYALKVSSGIGLPMNKYGYASIRTTNWHGIDQWGYLDRSFVYTNEGTTSSFNSAADGFSSFELGLAIDEAVGKALNRAKDQTANWAENVATYKQSVHMVASNMMRILNAYRAIRQGNVAKAAAALGVSLRGPARISNQSKAIANGWLELQYGWKPLLQDIYETTLAFQKRRREKPSLIRVTGSSARNKNRVEVITSDGGHTVTTYTHTVKLTAKVLLCFKVANEDLRLAAQMGITNPIALAWELLPFSFVIDWLLPVGNYFSNLDATLGTTYEKGCVTTCEDRLLDASSTSSGKDSVFFYNRQINAKYQMFSVNRQDLSAFPSQKVPHFKDPGSLAHLANAMALLRQQRR
jgi:hypothetical protein